jgi:hypothetical protein
MILNPARSSAREAAASRVTALVADLSSKRNRQGGTSRSFRLLVLTTFRYKPPAGIGMTPEQMGAEYSTALRITPARVRVY